MYRLRTPIVLALTTLKIHCLPNTLVLFATMTLIVGGCAATTQRDQADPQDAAAEARKQSEYAAEDLGVVDHVYQVKKLPVKVAFGSCSKVHKPQPILNTIAALKPDVFIYLGDSIYADENNGLEFKGKDEPGLPRFVARYEQLGAKREFQNLKSSTKLIATWDDHDYGKNDAGKEYVFKEDSKRIFLNFFEEPKDSPRWTRPGVYTSYYYKGPGNSLQIIVLDTRTFRDELISSNGRYVPNQDAAATLLGSAQWLWLEEQLKISADMRIIGSSIQFGHESNGYESWTNFPHQRQKMLDLIKKTGAKGVIFISGDVHWGEISKIEEPGLYAFYDVTSSGLTETWKDFSPNKYRIGEVQRANHFGLISFDWTSDIPRARLEIRDLEGEAVNGVDFSTTPE